MTDDLQFSLGLAAVLLAYFCGKALVELAKKKNGEGR